MAKYDSTGSCIRPEVKRDPTKSVKFVVASPRLGPAGTGNKPPRDRR